MHFLRQVYVNCDVCLKIFDLIYSWSPGTSWMSQVTGPVWLLTTRSYHYWRVSVSPCLLVSSAFHYQTSGCEREQSLRHETIINSVKERKSSPNPLSQSVKHRFSSQNSSELKIKLFFQTFFLYKEHSASRHFSECNFPMQCYKSFYHFLWGRGTGKIMWSSS